MNKLTGIFSNFKTIEHVVSIKPYGSGHINDTYKVETRDKNYLLQKINCDIFKNVEGLTSNIIMITNFLEKKLVGENSSMQILNPVKSNAGDYLFRDDNNYWRVFDFIENSKSFDTVDKVELAYEGGIAYGWFVKQLSDFPADELVETLPGFHNADFRIKSFREAVQNDFAGRTKDVKDLIGELEQRADTINKIHLLGDKGIIPKRVTHNDTKINNVLFNKNNKAMCVIDLDTVMPGYVHFDFGDAIRTFTNTGKEDETDLNKVSMDIKLFEGFAKGFLSEVGEVLSDEEVIHLAFAAKYIVYEQVIRFFSDYLNGDTYYKIKYPEHNLVRTRAQFKLLQSIEDQYEEMEDITQRLSVIRNP